MMLLYRSKANKSIRYEPTSRLSNCRSLFWDHFETQGAVITEVYSKYSSKIETPISCPKKVAAVQPGAACPTSDPASPTLVPARNSGVACALAIVAARKVRACDRLNSV